MLFCIPPVALSRKSVLVCGVFEYMLDGFLKEDSILTSLEEEQISRVFIIFDK